MNLAIFIKIKIQRAIQANFLVFFFIAVKVGNEHTQGRTQGL